jgi:hypothetical protein
MKRKIIFLISAVIIAIPWVFLTEVLPIPYNRISTFAEIVIECGMFAALLVSVSLLRRELKYMKQAKEAGGVKADGRWMRSIGRILFVLASFTLFVVGLILVLIALSFSL